MGFYMSEKSQTEKMLEMLMNGTPPEKIRAEYPNKGPTITNAIQMFLDKAMPQVRELQRKIGPLESQATTLFL
jgi:hypothetical protein